MPPTTPILRNPLRLGHLPLVMDVYRRCGLPDLIAKVIRDDPRRRASTSDAVAVILCGVFCGAHSLWRLRERLAIYDMPTIMQDPGFDLERFTEERLADALDDLHAYGLDKLMTTVAVQTIEQFRLDTSWLHFDTTSLTFFGAFEEEIEDEPMAQEDTPSAPRLAYGHSKAHRPDLKQLIFGALVTNDGGVPIWGEALDGNTSDSVAAAHFFGHVRALVADPTTVCCIADSKGWCARVLQVVTTEKMRLLSRLPRTHRLHQEIMTERWTDFQVELIPRSQASLPADRYEYRGKDVEVVVSIPAGEVGTSPQRLTVPARAVRVFSSALLRTKLATLGRQRTRDQATTVRLFRQWHDEVFACLEDAQRAADRHIATSELATCDITAVIEHHDGPAKRGRGRPRRRPEPPLAAKQHWRVRYAARTIGDHAIERRLRRQSSFILIRTRTTGWQISDVEMIRRYKDQYHVEQGFSWLKSGAMINPMYLHTPERMASLCFLYTQGLMIWNLIQRTVRAYLKKHKTGLPYHRNKPSQNITTRFLFELFPKVMSIEVGSDQGEGQRVLLELGEWQKLAAQALGTSEAAFQPYQKP